jgi:predicted exporter
MSARLRGIVLIMLLLGAGIWAGRDLKIGSDLARFMPEPHDVDERLLVDEIGSGPASRLLLMAIHADDETAAAQLSRGLRAALSADPAFLRIENGEIDEEAMLATLLPLRFTHSPAMDDARFDAAGLTDVLEARLADVGSVAGAAFEMLLAHDPQFLTLSMLEAWRPAREPVLRDGVWFSADGSAMLLTETAAAGFDPQAQADALAKVRAAFAALDGAAGARLDLSGPGSFSARMGERVRGEATWLGGVATAALLALLFVAYRSPVFVLATALPLACAAAAGILALKLVFDQAHGITLAFAFTLIGVAQDYPVHLLSHAQPGAPHRDVARALWPALRLGVASTVIAYATLFSAEVEGLAQLAVFTIAGLLAAALVTRFLLPDLLPPARRDVLGSRGFSALARGLERWHAGAWAALPVLALAVAAFFLSGDRPWWNNDLGSLTPLPKDWLEDDARLRADFATPDARWLLVLNASDNEAVLQLSEALAPRLDALVAAGVLQDHGLPTRYRPSEAVQQSRRARLPTPEALREAIDTAAERTGFEAAFFEPMIEDVRVARQPGFPATVAQAFAASAAGVRVAASLRKHANGTSALVELSGIKDIDAVRAAVSGESRARLLDVKDAAEKMVVAFRERVIAGLAIAAVALALVVVLALGPRACARVLPPMLLGLLATTAILRLAGVELTLFHLIALMLAAGLGMDYALFFAHAEAGDEQRRALHAVLISALSTALVFGLLATSSIPVLSAIGSTVGIGVVAQFLLSLSMARRLPHTKDSASKANPR